MRTGKNTDMENELQALIQRHAEEKDTLIQHYDAKFEVF